MPKISAQRVRRKYRKRRASSRKARKPKRRSLSVLGAIVRTSDGRGYFLHS